MNTKIISIEFTGEESARFTRFALLSLNAGVSLVVEVVGREPLTSRIVRIHGRVVAARLDGYIRYIVVEDDGAENLKYWVGGSNSTRSIAAQSIQYKLCADDLSSSFLEAEKEGVLLPGVSQVKSKKGAWDEQGLAIDRAVSDKDVSSLELVLALVSPEVKDSMIKREAALGLRSFAELSSTRISIQRKIERAILDSLDTTSDRETRIALVENLGYFGTTASMERLSLLAINHDDPHTRWAAIVAIGRLPDEINIQVLIDAFKVDGISDGENWPSAAALLSISRRVEKKDQEIVEPFLCSVLAEGNGTISRYACLALSRFLSVSECVFEELLVLLGNNHAEASSRGYAALAISGILHSLDEYQLQRIEMYVEKLHHDNVLGVEEPEDVWAQEFLAELASLLELEKVSTQLNQTLSGVYTDWRADYYDALASYSQAETFVRDGAFNSATNSFYAAVKRLEGISSSLEVQKGLNKATATFRLDITKARLRLHQLLQAWADSGGMSLDELVDEAAHIVAIYKRYSTHKPQLSDLKHLSERELKYVISTRRLVDLLRILIELDIASRSRGGFDIDEVKARIHDAVEYVDDLKQRFQSSLARGLEHLVSELKTQLDNLKDVAQVETIPNESKQNAIRDLMNDIRKSFGYANWPMPARACPVGGLGRGEIKVITEGLTGDGSQSKPLTFSSDDPVVLNIAIIIQEMAPGGATRADLKLRIGSNIYEQKVFAVEGPTTASLPIIEEIPTQQWLQIEVSLEFSARDCEQTAAQINVYLRKEK